MVNPSRSVPADMPARLPPFAALSEEIIARISIGFGSMGLGLCLFAPDDAIAYASPAFIELWNIQPEARTFADVVRHCHGTQTGIVIDTDDIDAWLAYADDRRRRAAERTFEVDMQDGRWFWATETLFDGGWLLLTISDITRLKANEHTLRQAHDAAVHWAETDALTGLYNRRFAMRRLAELADGAAPALTVALLDVDHFKLINDTHGHDTGDKVLQHFGTLGRLAIRKHDLIARVGGEEFLLLMPGTGAADAFRVVDRLRQQVAQASPIGEGGVHYTLSAGIAQLRPGESAEQIYKRADQALYRAKHTGRNRVETDA